MIKWTYCLAIVGMSTIQFSNAQTYEKVYVQTDRDLYGAQDTLWLKGYVFNQSNKVSDESLVFHFILTDENGNKINHRKWPILNGQVEGSIITPSKEGRYLLSAFSGQMVNAKSIFRKDIYVRSEIADELSFYVNDISKTNESINLDIGLKRSNTVAGKNERVFYQLWSDNGLVIEGKTRTNDSGQVKISIDELDFSENTYELTIEVIDQDLTKPVKLALPFTQDSPKIDLQFFPEGGNLVSSIPNNVAFKAIDIKGEPVNIKGTILDSNRNPLGLASSFYGGMGSFELTPEENEQYYLQIDEPKNIDSIYHLPKAIKSGLVSAIVDPKQTELLSFKIESTPDLVGSLVDISVFSRDGIVFNSPLTVIASQTISIPIPNMNPGILKMKISDSNKLTLSERLMFVRPNNRVYLKILTDKEKYESREKVTLQLKATDHLNKPIQGSFNFSAIDYTRNNLNLDSPSLLAQILLNSELRGSIPTPNFYFSDDPKAVDALNLVMLTNGWRKYDLKHSPDPESIQGVLVQKNSRKRRNGKRKVVNNTELKLTSLEDLNESLIEVDENGEFIIPSSYLKARGDSFLLASSKQDKGLLPNIQLDNTSKSLLNNYVKDYSQEWSDLIKKPDHKVFEKGNKVVLDKYQGSIILNSVTIVSRSFYGNICDVLAIDSKGNWKTKTREQLDMTNLDLVSLLKQVSDQVRGYGPITTRRVSYDNRDPLMKISPDNPNNSFLNDALAVRALLSKYDEQISISRKPFYRSIMLEWPVPFDVYLNCEYVEPNSNRAGIYPYKYYEYEDFETIDLTNLESISVNAPSTAGKKPNYFFGTLGIIPRPIIVIKTLDGKIKRKPRLNPYFFFSVYKTETPQFYKPSYETQQQKEKVEIDLRNTIHWQTNIITDQNGEATISFYNADRANVIGITVEGIDAYSRIGFGTSQYQVLEKETDKD